MTIGRLAFAASVLLLAAGAYAAFSGSIGLAIPLWLLALVPVQLAYGIYAEHADRSVWERRPPRDAAAMDDAVHASLRTADTWPTGTGLPEPEPFLPDCGPWPPPDLDLAWRDAPADRAS